ncbi:MAG: ATP-binding cassette domain-containing protein [Deltaproteobacteria bacterium]|nr:ATP-binding cassette domain-containing protein [Deltaproteobacteria bacterium]
MQYIVEARGLTKTFGDIRAVDGISFHILPGECFGMLGPNGAGKTSTIRMSYGFSPMTAGSLRIFGHEVNGNWRDIKSRIGVCPQDNNLDPDLTVAENLELYAHYFEIPKEEARRRTKRLLEFISLEHRRDAKVTELSGGLMRRLVITRALINNPELLILDEPTTGLDPQSRHQVWERLEELRFRGLSTLLTTHYMDEASRLCDRLVIMDYGKILVEGKPADLIKTYVGRDVIEVAAPSRELQDFVVAQHMEHENLSHRLVIYTHEGEKNFREISTRFSNVGCTLRMASLEDVFLKLTGRGLRE